MNLAKIKKRLNEIKERFTFKNKAGTVLAMPILIEWNDRMRIYVPNSPTSWAGYVTPNRGEAEGITGFHNGWYYATQDFNNTLILREFIDELTKGV